MTGNELQMRANIISGDYAEPDNIGFDDDFGPLQVSDSDDDDIDNTATALKKDQQNRKERTNNLMYNDSDSEDELRLPLKPIEKKKSTKKINIFDMIKNNDDNDNYNDQTIQSNVDNELASDDDDDANSLHMNRSKKRPTVIDSDSESDEKPEAKSEEMEINTEEFSSQVIRSRLAALEDSDSEPDNDPQMSRSIATKKSRNVIESDDSDNENKMPAPNAAIPDSPTQLHKRQRSGIDDDEIDNDGPFAPVRQHKKPRLSIVDDDDTSE